MAEKKILCISFDKVVGDLRCEGLAEVGYQVTGTTLPEYALELLACERFDLVIVGHRFDKQYKKELALACRKQKTPLLLVCGASEDKDIPAATRVYALDGMTGLLKAVSGLLASRSAAQRAG